MPELYRVKAELFRTLGHPARIRILELLAERDRAVHELLGEIEIEPSNLSQQLAVLRRAGLVDQRREGAEVVYAASVPGVAELLRVARGLLAEVLADRASLREELAAGPEGPGPGAAGPEAAHGAEVAHGAAAGPGAEDAPDAAHMRAVRR